jgi:hypothetical protein
LRIDDVQSLGHVHGSDQDIDLVLIALALSDV